MNEKQENILQTLKYLEQRIVKEPTLMRLLSFLLDENKIKYPGLKHGARKRVVEFIGKPIGQAMPSESSEKIMGQIKSFLDTFISVDAAILDSFKKNNLLEWSSFAQACRASGKIKISDYILSCMTYCANKK